MAVWSRKVFVSTLATNGIKRHLAVDTLGFPFFTHCTRANLSDDAGLIEMFTLNIDYFKSKPIDSPKITILLDHGYHPEYFTQELEQIYPEIMTKIQFQLSAKLSKQEKAAQGKCGFVPAVAFRGDRALQRARWSVVKFWLRTLNEPWLAPLPNSTSASSG